MNFSRNFISLCVISLLLNLPISLYANDDLFKISTSSQYFIDNQSSTHIFRGINLVAKNPPYTPQSIGFNENVAKFLKDSGVTVVRLGILWAGVEPLPGVYDDAYIGQIRSAANLLAKYGIYTILDSHQDMLNEQFGIPNGGPLEGFSPGEGFPSWAIITNGYPDGLPYFNIGPQGFSDDYLTSLGLMMAYRNFWLNVPAGDNIGIQDHFVKAWKHVASIFINDVNILGYNILNEPNDPSLSDRANGGLFNTFLGNIGSYVDWRQGLFTNFLNNAINGIRTVDKKTIIFYPYDIATSVLEPPPILQNLVNGPNLAQMFSQYSSVFLSGDLTPYYYNQLYQANYITTIRNNPFFIAEWGQDVTNTNDMTIPKKLDMYDHFLASATFWELGGYPMRTTTAFTTNWLNDISQSLAISNTNTNLNQSYFYQIRPYAQVIAGTPISMVFDTSTKTFTLTYSTNSPVDQSCNTHNTTIYVPTLVYPSGYSVNVSGGKIASKDNQMLVIANGKCQTNSTVTVIITTL